MATSDSQLDYYTLLDVPSHASFDEIAAAYERLLALYSPERLQNGPPEFQELAAHKRTQFEAAYRVLSDPDRRAAYDREQQITPVVRAEPLDYRPLPPARGRERALDLEQFQARSNPERAVRREGIRSWLPLILIMLGGLAVLLQLVLSNVRVVDGPVALVTPTIPNLSLPFTAGQLAQFRSAAESANTFESWRALGNAFFDNQQMMRENAPQSPQYRAALGGWLEAIEAYERALALQEDEAVRSDRALSLFSYGLDAPDSDRAREGIAEAERALQREIREPRALLNYGLILASANPPRLKEAATLWRKVQQIAPGSPEAQRAQELLQRYGRQ